MRFKELTIDEKNYIASVYNDKSNDSWEKRAAKLGDEFGVSERTIRKWVSNKLGLKERLEIEPEQYIKAKKRLHDKTKKRFIISWCQNNTPINKGLLKNIENYASHIGADIHIILGRYKNPTSVFEDKSEEFWDESILKYADANSHNIHKYLSILSNIKVQPTAINPMSGLQSISGINSCIIGSPKVQLEMLPVLEGNKPKMMLTTGSISQKNYTDSKSGCIGNFHHVFGFCIVELKDDETFFVRHVTANDNTGNFTDLIYKVENGVVKKINTMAGAILGDLHYGDQDQELLDLSFDFFNKVKPKYLVGHDVYNGDAISHHTIKDPFIQYGKEINGTNDLAKEIEIMMDGLKAFENFENVIIVRSNHDEALDRWLKTEDWRKQPTFKNAPLYMELSGKLLKQYALNPYKVKGIIPELINDRFPKFITLDRNTSYKIKGFEIGQHGDSGSNGSRGSLQQFRKLNTKCVVGHYHSPQRKDGALAVGTATKLRVGYNNSASSWCQASVLIHEDGRAQHMIFDRDMNGKLGFTTFEY